ncbi:ribosome-associated ATPase/putative transporter RbbA [Parvibaculum sp.]|uniref:ribosome-associated ATPase/putative transporter RbbA n=1 Tax=Parvibaculum sp. TaxID=2024848 RepID=UPI00321136E8
MSPAERAVAVEIRSLKHRYARVVAVDDISVQIPAGVMAGLIGPDGVGKSTLLALISGVRKMQQGEILALGGDMRDHKHRSMSHRRIAYMPQGLGRNLYPTLSVFENLDFFGRLFGQGKAERESRIKELLRATGLDPFPDRPAGKLSGGMKQKLALCCALIHDPDLLILDEPTTGVDPLSRRQFWELIERIRARRPGMSVIVATAYMEEADRFDWLAAMNAGKLIGQGSPAELKARTGKETLEEAFIALLPEALRAQHVPVVVSPRIDGDGAPAIEAEGLTCRFGDFVAVDHVSFSIERGEIFGFLGSNGCGKTTTMKMLTGLLPATEGFARLFGERLNANDMATRRRVGYMSQSFSLYGELSVRQNLDLHARLFELPRNEVGPRVEEMLKSFDLADVADEMPEGLPLGIRQRLQLAVAVIHRPEVLILDEPTSGVDPIMRDQFWRYLLDLSRNQKVTIFISTHFMNEAERCDRISLMHAGKVLAVGAPQDIAKQHGRTTLEDAFIDCLRDAAGAGATDETAADETIISETDSLQTGRRFDWRRIWAYARRETMEILRDPIRLTFALAGPIVLMLTFGYGISFDVENLAYSVYDQDQSPESRGLLEQFEGSRYFEERTPAKTASELHNMLQGGKIAVGIEIPEGFGRDLLRGRKPEISVLVDGASPFRATTAVGYLSGIAQRYFAQLYEGQRTTTLFKIETRTRYNQAFESVYAIVPTVFTLILILIPAMLTAVGVVREKEYGSIANFRSTPVSRLEFLVGKQAPYIVLAYINFLTLLLLALFLFGVPVRGSVPLLFVGAFLYVSATTGYGIFISTFTRTQVSAMFATAVTALIPAVNFSGLLVPVSSLTGTGRAIGLAFPSSWFQELNIGVFTKGLYLADLWAPTLMLVFFALVYTIAGRLFLRKQEA